MTEMTDYRHCFKCHREINRWGIDSLGVLLYIPIAADDHYFNKCLNVCNDCLPKVSIPEAITQTRLTRKLIVSKYPLYPNVPCFSNRKCQRCCGSITLFYQDVSLYFYDWRCGPLVDYCARCYPKVYLDKAYQDHLAVWPQFEIARQKWCDEHPEEMAMLQTQFEIGSD